ncbi:hypothetical protein [Deinococcus peraridilitoris]|uniref:hypothetical protein n=1 Tax=Deinococcus peraridilitoris TaxID=432329 RepID=UPI00145E6860|nr:hypothetical protein [Deinococcus peraridilitoris]
MAAPDVAEVRRLLQEGNVQLVLVSPSLHDVSWEGLVSDLCALHAVPIWVWGGHAHPKERQRALAAGAAAYHDKPHDIEGYKTLLREIERVVEPR